MSDVSRRSMLKLAAAAPLAAGFAWTDAEVVRARERVAGQAAQAKTPFAPAFFDAHEYATLSVLVDLIIPKDDQSGSATDAGVPEFIDFMMNDDPTRRTAMRGGL